MQVKCKWQREREREMIEYIRIHILGAYASKVEATARKGEGVRAHDGAAGDTG